MLFMGSNDDISSYYVKAVTGPYFSLNYPHSPSLYSIFEVLSYDKCSQSRPATHIHFHKSIHSFEGEYVQHQDGARGSTSSMVVDDKARCY